MSYYKNINSKRGACCWGVWMESQGAPPPFVVSYPDPVLAPIEEWSGDNNTHTAQPSRGVNKCRSTVITYGIDNFCILCCSAAVEALHCLYNQSITVLVGNDSCIQCSASTTS